MMNVTVLIPLYGESAYIEDAIESVINQDFPAKWEILVIYKNAKESLAKIKDYQNIILIEQRSSGLSSALNEGIQKSQYEYVARLDSDDLMTPNRIKVQMQQFIRDQDLVAVGGQACIVDEHGKAIGSIAYPCQSRLVNWCLSFSSCVPHPGVTFLKSAVIAAGGYRSGFIHAEDYDLWVRLRTVGNVANVNQKVLVYRRHNRQLTAANFDETLRTSAAIMTVSDSKQKDEIFLYENFHQITLNESEIFNQYLTFLILSSRRKYGKILLLALKASRIRKLFMKKTLLKLYFLVKKITKIFMKR